MAAPVLLEIHRQGHAMAWMNQAQLLGRPAVFLGQLPLLLATQAQIALIIGLAFE
jgi:hypothetical protein